MNSRKKEGQIRVKGEIRQRKGRYTVEFKNRRKRKKGMNNKVIHTEKVLSCQEYKFVYIFTQVVLKYGRKAARVLQAVASSVYKS